MREGTLAEIVDDPARTHCVLVSEEDVRSVRIASDTDRYRLTGEETAVLGDLWLFSGDAAAVIQGGLEFLDEEEPVRILHTLCGGEEVDVFLPASW